MVRLPGFTAESGAVAVRNHTGAGERTRRGKVREKHGKTRRTGQKSKRTKNRAEILGRPRLAPQFLGPIGQQAPRTNRETASNHGEPHFQATSPGKCRLPENEPTNRKSPHNCGYSQIADSFPGATPKTITARTSSGRTHQSPRLATVARAASMGGTCKPRAKPILIFNNACFSDISHSFSVRIGVR